MIDRRRLLSTALAIPAAVTAPDTRVADPPVADPPVVDPLPAWLAEDERLCSLSIVAREAADRVWFPLSQAERTKKRRRAVYRSVVKIDKRARALWQRICSTPPVTIGGAVAQLEVLARALFPEDPDEREGDALLLYSVIRGLREMQDRPAKI